MESQWLPQDCVIHSAESVIINERPVRLVDLSTPNGNRQFFVGIPTNSQLALFTVGDFDPASPSERDGFLAIVRSIRITGAEKSQLWPWLAAGAICAVAIAVLIWRRSHASPPPARRKRR
jgi:hypothetical protein